MKALVLAAGKGERLKELTFDRPKALVEINGKPLIEYVFEFLNHPAIKEIGIVGGYKFDALSGHLRTYALTHLRTFFNPHFADGSVRTIMTALDFLDDDFILLNTDHIYPKKMLEKFLSQTNGITAACDFDRQLTHDDMKVKFDDRRKLAKIRKDLNDFDCGYIGMTYVPKAELPAYKQALAETYETYGKASNAEAVLGHMAANGHSISIADLSHMGWFEVDTPEDMEKAEKEL